MPNTISITYAGTLRPSGEISLPFLRECLRGVAYRRQPDPPEGAGVVNRESDGTLTERLEFHSEYEMRAVILKVYDQFAKLPDTEHRGKSFRITIEGTVGSGAS